jgi:hypothetical protein
MRAIVPLIVVLIVVLTGCGSVVVDDDCDGCDELDAADAVADDEADGADDHQEDDGEEADAAPIDADCDTLEASPDPVPCEWVDDGDCSVACGSRIVASIALYLVPGTTLSVRLEGTDNVQLHSEGPCNVAGPPGDYECTPTEDGRSSLWVSVDLGPHEYHVTAAGTCHSRGTP